MLASHRLKLTPFALWLLSVVETNGVISSSVPPSSSSCPPPPPPYHPPHPRGRNANTSMAGLKNGHIPKNITQNGEPQRHSWEYRRRRRRSILLLSFLTFFLPHNRLVGLVIRRPPRERKIPNSNPACAGIFSGSSHTSDLKIGTPVATLPGAWRYRVSTGTGRLGVSIL